MPLRLGKMTTPVEVQVNTPGHGTSGEPTESWAKSFDAWGWVEEAKGDELWLARSTQARPSRAP